jgi:drug/metabolite transporter (DMT)-like permease
MKSFKGYLYILGATFFWGVSATIAKYLFTRHVGTLVLVQMRITLSCVLLLGAFLLFRRDLLVARPRDLYRFALLGIFGVAGSNFAYYFTIEQTNVATAILLQYMAPLVVLLYAALSGEERLTAASVGAGVVSLAGCVLAVLGKDFSLLKVSRIGLLSGMISAVCWAFTNIWLRRILREYNIWTALVYAFVFASLFWLFFNTPQSILAAHYDTGQWLIFGGFAVVSILIPHSLYFLGIRHLTATHAVITATSEPVIAIGSAFLFMNESLTAVQTLGAVLVVAAIAILQMKERVEREEIP